MNRPDPLTPPDSDLRDFQFMPLDVVRFAQSDLVSMEDPEAVLAALLLWGAAWHSTPAGSLTDDDRVLAKAAGYGRSVGEWLRIREAAMRGFIACSDGRLYHPVVAEKVVEAWTGKLRQRHRTYCAAVRKHNERDKEKADQRPSPSFEEWMDADRPQSVVTSFRPSLSRVTGDDVARDIADNARDERPMSQPSHAENASKGQGQGQGQGQGHPIDIGTSSLLPARSPDAANDDAKASTALAPIDPVPAAKGRAAKRRFAPDGWQPKQHHAERAAANGIDLGRQAELFRNHEFKDGKSDFDRAFTTWLINAGGRFAERPAPVHRGGRETWNALDQAAEGFDWTTSEDAA